MMTGGHMTAQSDLASLLMLADGRLPVGAHANGGGVEWAFEHDDLSDVDTLEVWLRGRLQTSGSIDAAFAVAASTAAESSDTQLLLDAEYAARVVGDRARLVSRQMGRQFARAARRIWPHLTAADALDDGPFAPIALGVTAGALGVDPQGVAMVALHQTVATVATAAVRLSGLDPLAVAAMQARLSGTLDAIATDAVEWAVTPPAELPSLTSPLAEILAEDHGQWGHRLFLA